MSKVIYALIVTVILVVGAVIPALIQAQRADGPDAVVREIDTFLRLRAAPSTRSAIRAELLTAAPLTVIGKSEDDEWLAVLTHDERLGWVSREYVDLYADYSRLPTYRSGDVMLPEPRLRPAVITHMREIYARGQTLGRRPDSFVKVGDSISASSNMLTPLAQGVYDLTGYEELQWVLDHYAQAAENPLGAKPIAAGVGWTAFNVVDTTFSAGDACRENESPLACAYRVDNPSVALIMFGSNDVGLINVSSYTQRMREIIEYSIDQGVIPVISTFPIRAGHEEKSHTFNAAVIALGEEYNIPVWRYGGMMQSLPNNGLDGDGVHPSLPPKGGDGVTLFTEDNLYSGYVIRNLTALQMLDAVLQAVL